MIPCVTLSSRDIIRNTTKAKETFGDNDTLLDFVEAEMERDIDPLLLWKKNYWLQSALL